MPTSDPKHDPFADPTFAQISAAAGGRPVSSRWRSMISSGMLSRIVIGVTPGDGFARALYAPTASFQTPHKLMKAYGIWNDWAMWQYAGVEWSGRSVSKHYHHGPWKSPRYFGTMDRPLEHNAFNGSTEDLNRFWEKHSWAVR